MEKENYNLSKIYLTDVQKSNNKNVRV